MKALLMTIWLAVVVAVPYQPIESQSYIIKLKKDAPTSAQRGVIKYLKEDIEDGEIAAPAQITQKISGKELDYGLNAQFNTIKAFSVVLTEADLTSLKQEFGEYIEYAERDKVAKMDGYTIMEPHWGQERVTVWPSVSGLKKVEVPSAAGEGVSVYVIDSGVNPNHPSMPNVRQFRNYVNYESNEDLKNHGTHVAGTIASSKYGLAPKATIYSSKVADKDGECSMSDVIEAIQDVLRVAVPYKTIINLSLGSDYLQSLNDMVKAAYDRGVLVVTSAGNYNADACYRSPASSPYAITVGASDKSDQRASFSNWGTCVDVYAPGVFIPSLSSFGYRDEYLYKDGTSMAAPQVAGVAALYMSTKNYTSTKAIVNDILESSRKVLNDLNTLKGIAYVNSTYLQHQ